MQQTIITRQRLRSGSETQHPSKLLPNGGELSVPQPAANALVDWGRRQRSSWFLGAACCSFMAFCPILVTFVWITLEYHDASLLASFAALASEGPVPFAIRYAPRWDGKVTIAYGAWVAVQALLYTVLPGKTCKGQLTPAGNMLDYKVNGLLAWVVTLVAAAALTAGGWIDPAILAKNWGPLICTLNVLGLAFALVFYVKAHVSPSHAKDRKFSGSMFYDLYMGIELNPRFGKNWDVKLFQNGHLGMMVWIIIDLSFTALQYQRFGYVTNSIIIVDILHALYVADLFINEQWYLHTIDICHEHFGFYFAWGTGVFLPTTYTLQAQYLSGHAIQLNPIVAAMILLLGFGGYTVFRTVNHQKHVFRSTKGDCKIWGKAPEYIACSYKTADGSVHNNQLLCSGGWGIVRHANYVGDLMLSYSMCAACGFGSLIPWTYAIFMTIILVHRCRRDEARCLRKYGDAWTRYCAEVRWKMIPGIY